MSALSNRILTAMEELWAARNEYEAAELAARAALEKESEARGKYRAVLDKCRELKEEALEKLKQGAPPPGR